ncbi:MAG: hypothetical protein B6243_08620 [Anaerolineaceae bacterium 4572_5.2]|nr:MAG: hypothetical protein B6243_08620 [Anaerolineaceae bacterium 4572_5.2]
MSKQILIVDDDNDILQVVRLALQSADYQVETAQDGLGALKKLEHYQPDLIVTDYNMPYMSGDVLFQMVKQDPKRKTIPFIFLTAKDDTSTKVQSLQNGATDYITKPFSKDELLARVATHIAYHDTLKDDFQQKLEKLRADLLNNVSHELRTPLAVIMGYAGVLLEDMHEAPDMQLQFMQSIQKASLRLKKVIENLIFLSKAQSGQIDYYPQPLQVKPLLTSLVKYYRQNVGDEIVLNLPSQPLPILGADHKMAQIAIEQLIDNALKFKAKGQQASATVSALATETEMQISVQDKGIGLSPEYKTLIFEPLR